MLSFSETDHGQLAVTKTRRTKQRPLDVSVGVILAAYSAAPTSQDDATFLQLKDEVGHRGLDETYAYVKAAIAAAGGTFIDTTVNGRAAYINAELIASMRGHSPTKTTIVMQGGHDYVADEPLDVIRGKV